MNINKINKLLTSRDMGDMILGLEILFSIPEIVEKCKKATQEKMLSGEVSNYIYVIPTTFEPLKSIRFIYNDELYKCISNIVLKSLYEINGKSDIIIGNGNTNN